MNDKEEIEKKLEEKIGRGVVKVIS